MTPSQFNSFVQQNDRSLLALRREITQSQDLDAATQLALEAVLIKMRVAFLEYGKQICASDGGRRESVTLPIAPVVNRTVGGPHATQEAQGNNPPEGPRPECSDTLLGDRRKARVTDNSETTSNQSGSLAPFTPVDLVAKGARSAREADQETLIPCQHEHRRHITDDIYQCEDAGCGQQFKERYV
jgi:hypothetical protein